MFKKFKFFGWGPGNPTSLKNKRGLPVSVRVTASFQHYLAAVAIVKNEGQYLREWLTFHEIVGVSHFFIYDNSSSDNSREILDEFVRKGFVTLVQWPDFFPWRASGGSNAQEAAYAHAIFAYGETCRWMMFIDADEFVFPREGSDLCEVLRTFEDVPSLALPWLMFGHSGHRAPPTGLIIENYTRRAKLPINLSLAKYKSIVDPRRARYVRVHRCVLDEGEVIYTQQRDRISAPEWKVIPPNPDDKIILNHYFTKSVEEFDAKARRFQAGTHSKENRKLARRDLIEVATEDDFQIQRFLPQVRQKLDREPGQI